MKKIICIVAYLFLFLLPGCKTTESGNYIIKYNSKNIKTSEVRITDEENKIKYKDSNGKWVVIEGSFEVIEQETQKKP